jgi:hypothetical protein
LQTFLGTAPWDHQPSPFKVKNSPRYELSIHVWFWPR